MSRSPALLVGAGLLFLSAGCRLVDLEAELGEACLTHPDIQVDGLQGATHMDNEFVFDDLAALDDLLALDADLELALVRAELRATSGISSLAFVEIAQVTIASGDPGSTLPSLAAYGCSGDCLPDGAALAIPAIVQDDAVEYLETGSLRVDLNISGNLPATSWTAEIDVCVQGHVKYAVDL